MVSSSALSQQVLKTVQEWAARKQSIRGLALVGSHARGEARPDSDVDLVLLVDNPNDFRADAFWLTEINWNRVPLRAIAHRDAQYGIAWSRHVGFDNGVEVEFTFAPPSWANVEPIDAGTLSVMTGGCRILHDPDGRLGALCAAAGCDVG
jgi:hypothetical protein